MNCKPGDLAVVIKATDEHEHGWIGKVVRVVRLIGSGLDGSSQCWEYEGTRLIHPLYGSCIGIADIALRPIRDPGPDAVDEMVAKLGPALPVTYEEMLHG
jgi:hypothetical protein